MEKRCEVCDRKIRSGYRYCWEHRHTSQAARSGGMKTFNDAERGYRDFRLKKLTLWVGLICFASVVLGLIIYKIINNITPFLLGLVICFVIVFKGKEFNLTTIEKEIVNRDEKYIEYIKEFVSQSKEENRFKNHLLSADHYSNTKY
jgi:hypothetical protein